jgi:hypothetical protein
MDWLRALIDPDDIQSDNGLAADERREGDDLRDCGAPWLAVLWRLYHSTRRDLRVDGDPTNRLRNDRSRE